MFRGDKNWTKADWFFLGAAFSAIPVWLLTADPTLSVVIVTLIELAGLGPTMRKTLRDPWSESLLYFALCVLKYLLVVLALEKWTVAVAFYPAVNLAASIWICTLMAVRRRSLGHAGMRSRL